jgi:GTP pyrophosphokinase
MPASGKVGGEPYVAHLLAVCSIALEYGADETTAIAALLHDAVEDQGGAKSREEIRHRFGDQVTAIVDECSDTEVTPKPPWRQRKEAHIAHAASASTAAKLIMAADKLHNLRSLVRELRRSGAAIWQHFSASPQDVLWYQRSMRAALADGIPLLLAEDIGRAIAEFDSLL